ncbi:unnamed protein product [Rotaria magnacalcarata]|uniref:Uncharacterized protein n=1 Tax=Rotaria magnacalcarata TaxID=392030 RepID=A0A8S3FWT1_9BILA|nr:unnamed protein product [Rotaria magnacalcarata]
MLLLLLEIDDDLTVYCVPAQVKFESTKSLIPLGSLASSEQPDDI